MVLLCPLEVGDEGLGMLDTVVVPKQVQVPLEHNLVGKEFPHVGMLV